MGTEDKSLKVVAETVGKVAGDIYADVAQPAARQVGTALETLFKVGFSPIAMLDWGFEQSKEWLKSKIAERLDEIPEDCRTTPPNNISVPAITNIAMSGDAPELRDLYAELLLKSMDCRTSDMVHPSYITLVTQLSPEEALIFVSFHEKTESNLFTDEFNGMSYKDSLSIEEQFEEYCRSLGFDNTKRAQVWLENLQRLRLIEIEKYADVQYRPEGWNGNARWSRDTPSVDTTEYRNLHITEFGRAFLDACAPSKPNV